MLLSCSSHVLEEAFGYDDTPISITHLAQLPRIVGSVCEIDKI
jgi:hypothetical protein